MAFLSAADILNANDREIEELFIKEWGGSVRIRPLSGKERDEFEASTVKVEKGQRKEDFSNFRARLISKCLVNEDGTLMFTSKHDVLRLGDKSVAAIQRIYDKCQEVNAMSDEDVEELTEGFESTPDEDSTFA